MIEFGLRRERGSVQEKVQTTELAVDRRRDVGGCTAPRFMGMRPVAEMQFADFISCGWDQLVTVVQVRNLPGVSSACRGRRSRSANDQVEPGV